MQKKDLPNEIEKLEEAFFIYLGEIDLTILETEFPVKWKILPRKLGYPNEFFGSIDDYQNPVENSQK